jgi:hypothetical protein
LFAWLTKDVAGFISLSLVLQMKKSKLLLIGGLTTLLGVGMFIFGASMFSYAGPSLNPIISKLGMYSFFLWLPVLGIGLVMFFIGVFSRKK